MNDIQGQKKNRIVEKSFERLGYTEVDFLKNVP